MKIVKVDIWSDFVCPWCWIAKRRFDQAVEQLAGQIQVEVSSRAYRIARGMAPMDFASALRMKFGSESGARQMMAAVTAHGAREGLAYNFGTMRFGDTADAHALVKSLPTQASRQRLIEALSKASITDGKDIFNRDELRAIAAQAGLSDAEWADLDFERVREVEHDEMQANAIANGVPLFVFNDKLYLSGAQPTETFVAALTQAGASSPEPVAAAADGAACGPDACQI
ncbi:MULTISPECIES: DsbA family oxidoreductase [Pseudomonadota]|uniref:DsbA family oxidoreductase n=1 Tax=Alcaligenes xylosoxydans xylosoxydans TaxID=85698 RepID=A0A9X3L7T5_ALCXX|nr:MULTISPECIES: DsbA family oxidoreductase [Pseudomonadota]KIL05046.1 DSBA oxidoreductase [Stutzerimonas stutzeri]MBH3547986.1 DsbA family oxidoreductase [Pseudomonas aeruginosa]MBH9082723.1 DsbA family oxidoreductase [Pseudomonas aeruginosa]MCS8350404.1 DsbA family oxidoreductase [Pseudomonas aeruginosa]MCS9727072.1 DsbA family oxidoreductase [Pseudomonas aeruginosa]